ncbi:MAG: ferritin [Thermoguttaceae bacterium]
MYLSMSAYFEARNFHGMARWMRTQSGEEWKHAMKLFDYIVERGGRVALQPIAAPRAEWASVLDAFENAYKHECKISGMIHCLVKMADSEADYATFNFLQWYVGEQVEEEAHASTIVEKLKMMGEGNVGLFMLDGELARRAE